MRLAHIALELRSTSDRFGGIPDYLNAAGELDAALGAFFKEQTMETLQRVNGAVARCQRLLKWRSIPASETV